MWQEEEEGVEVEVGEEKAVGSLQRETTCFIRGKNKNNIDRACRQTRTDAAADFTGLKDVIPLCA